MSAEPDRAVDRTSEHVRRIRASWETRSAAYQRQHAGLLGATPRAWGVWRQPEDELQVLGDLTGKAVLELGCGAAQWSIALARAGARPVGLDVSAGQLRHARLLAARAGVELPLLQADAERLPLSDKSFDVVFCDFGALSFTDPHRTVPEVARVLRPGGVLAFSASSPIQEICWSDEEGRPGTVLRHDYFGLRALDDPNEGSTKIVLPYGEWVRLFRRHGFVVEDLIELQPPEGATSTYRTPDDLAWARRWPMELIWKIRKA
jgi:SAM-dependent methyltransferase